MPKQRDYIKQQQIETIATKLVLKTGFYSLKMADVAKKSNMATGTVYIYFKNKEELISSIYQNIKSEIALVIMQKYKADKPYNKNFKAMWKAYFVYAYTHIEKIIFVEQFLYSGILPEKVINECEQYFLQLDYFLTQGIMQKKWISTDVVFIKAQLMGAIHELVKTLHKTKLKLTDKLLNEFYGMSYQALSKK